ncbi:MAG: di-heme oxidoredictase family protein [Cellvibrio sp.]|uniref:di-heme oxidoredictase family protein n=1 Tax=Cellvibrio sp. TaxID=1965322 RepID=UPI0031A6EDD4
MNKTLKRLFAYGSVISSFALLNVALLNQAQAQTTGISASKNAQNKIVLDYTFNERKTGGMWLTAYENGTYSYTTITGATETSLANGYWRYVYTTNLQCDAGDQFTLRVQGNYSTVSWLPGPTDTTFYSYNCASSGSSSAASSSVALPANAPVVNATAGNGSVALSWAAVANATSYRINYGFATGTLNSVLTTAGISINVGGLSNGFAYDFTVTAINSAGEKTSARVTRTPQAPASSAAPSSTPVASSSRSSSSGAPVSSAAVSSSNGLPAASTRVENGVLISNFAERYRVRHELSGNDFNNFNIEYWVGRFGYVELRDYTRAEAASQRQAACGTTEACVVVTLTGAVPAAMTDSSGATKSCNQQVPNWRYHKYFGDETNFEYGYVMDIVLPNGTVVPACNATQAQRTAATKWRAVMQRWQHINRPFEQGAQIEFETTINFDRAQLTGDNVNYYGQTFKYVLGEGFTVNNRDSAIGPLNVNDSFAKLGGNTTVPQLSATGGAQQRFAYMQHAYNIGANHIADWLMGRRVLHTNMINGNHVEQFMPGPQAQGGNLPMPELANLATNPIQPSCTGCHTLNGSSAMQPGQNVVPPKMIGMGLLGAIPDATIEGWAAQNGGRVNRVTVNGQQQIGRYGWRAETVSLRHQVAKALKEDMGVGSSFPGFGPQEISDQRLDQLVTYLKLLSVPVPRTNLTTHAGHQQFTNMGCGGCHKMTVTTGVDANFPELSNQTIHPYTDLLLHDLGEGEFRTAPLWGIGLSGYVRTGTASSYSLMHDGASTTLEAAISRHNGDAATAKANYNAASAANRQALINYLQAL